MVSEEKVSTPTFNKAIELFGNEGVVDIVGLVGYYNFVAMTLKLLMCNDRLDQNYCCRLLLTKKIFIN
ncbi:MAG: hypothetical protein CM1200mP40_33490 [Gammaproteobacteria bacterium]|nr:MAG: hypothetical protein CM1200mP40_33490 [Gammaproteobacteria bacterium]